jgi:hypothetical protein
MEKNAEGKLAITRVELRPKITWGGDRTPSAEQLDKMHLAAHVGALYFVDGPLRDADAGRGIVSPSYLPSPSLCA